jgi:hypothetical protein
MEGIVLGYRSAAEPREQAQRVAVGNPFAQLAIVPVLDPHQNQRAQHLSRRYPAAPSVRLLQPTPQVAAYPRDQFLVVVQEVGDRGKQRLQLEPLPHQLPVGKAELGDGRSRHASLRYRLAAFIRSRFKALM